MPADTDVVLIPLQAIVVHRGDRRITPRIGKPFQFTKDEANDLPETAYRHPEDPADPDEQFADARVEQIRRSTPRVTATKPVRPSGARQPARRPADNDGEV